VAGFAHAGSDSAGQHYRATLDGTRHLLAEAQKSGVDSFVFISSVKAMREPGSRCLDESAEDLPEDEYGLSRRQAEELVLDAGRRTGMHVSILRPALVYGPGCKGNLLSMLRWIDKGLFPPIPDTGNRRSMVDVRDLVRAILLGAERETANGETCIITDGQDYSTQRIYTAMRAALGKPASTHALPVRLLRALGKAGDAIESITHRPALYNSAMCARLLDSACYRSINAEPALGFRPEFRLEDALPGMVDVYRQQQT
jgi:nucleoside-diphosphate-sugar epimerase